VSFPSHEGELDAEANEKIRVISQRSLGLATACLAVTTLVLVIALIGMVTIASSAQKDADDTQRQAEILNTELACRSIAINAHALAQANLSLTQAQLEGVIALALIEIEGNRPVGDLTAQLAELQAELERRADVLDATGINRTNSVEDCDLS
jgi:hypothetical protein